MAFRVSTIQAVVVADTRKFDLGLRGAQKTAEAFAQRSAKSFGRLNTDLEAVRKAVGMTDKQFAQLQASIKNQTAFTAASRALDRIARSANLTDAEIRKLERSMGVTGKSGLSSRFKADTQAAQSYQNALVGLKSAISGYLSINMLRDVAKTSIDIASIQKTFYALTGSAQGAKAEIAYLREESQRLGLDFFALAESFKGFSAAGKTAGMSAAEVREIFTSVTEASTVMGLSSDRTKLALYALEQMLSKGAVSMEELRRQLGDQLPGAFQLGAKAMNMTTREFAKLVETGQLASAEFLPKFAAELRKAFGPGLAEAMKTPRAEIQRLMNEITESKRLIGEGGFLAGLSSGAKELAESLRSIEVKGALLALGNDLGTMTGILAKGASVAIENADAIKALGVAYIAAKVSSSALAKSAVSSVAAIGHKTVALNASINASVTSSRADYEAAIAMQVEARAAHNAAWAKAANTTSTIESIVATRALRNAEIELAAADELVATTKNQLAIATNRASLAFKAGSIAAAGSMGAFSNLKSLLGSLALPAVAVGIYAVATADSYAEREAKKHGLALSGLNEQYARLVAEANAAAEATDNFTEEQKKAAAKLAQERLDAAQSEVDTLREMITRNSRVYRTGLLGGVLPGDKEFKDHRLIEYYAEFKKLVQEFENGDRTAESLGITLGGLRQKIEKVANESSFNSNTWDAELLLQTVQLVESGAGSLRDALFRLIEAKKATSAVTNDVTQKLMDLKDALKHIKNLSDLSLRITLSKEEFSAKKLADEINQYKQAITAMALANKSAEASMASLSLSMLQAGAEAAGYDSLKTYANERAGISEILKKIEMGEVEYKKYTATEKYKALLAGLKAEREVLEAEKLLMEDRVIATRKYTVEELRIRRERAAALSGDINGLDKIIARIEANHAALLREFGGGGGGGFKPTEDVIGSLSTKIDEMRAKLKDDAGETFLTRFNRELAEWEKKGSGLKGAKKSEYAARLEEYRTLGGQYADKEAQKEAEKNMQVRLDFEREYASMVGLTADAVSGSLQRQYEEYRKAGVDIIQLEEWKRDKILRASRDASAGMYVALRDYSLDATNAAKNVGQVVSNSLSSMEDALVNFVTTGKLEFKDMVNSMIADLARLAIRQTITGPLASALGSALGGMLGGGEGFGGTTGGPGGGEYFGGTTGGSGFAKGGAFSAGTGLSSYRNSIVSSPTYFPFAKGGTPNIGLMGEKSGSPGEAIMPLARAGNGDLGVKVMGAGAVVVEPRVNINVENNTSAQVSTRTSQDSSGGFNIDVLINEIDNRMAQRVTNGTSRTGAAMDRTRSLNRANALYS